MDKIIIKGAREHNLKNISLELPRDKLIVITGLSGSGKSSLAFDTIYAEGQRRYVESLSTYARQFMEQMQKPDVDYIGGLSPAISIEQRTASANPRSTVATITEIYDYLRLLYSRIGIPYCYKCGLPIKKQSVQEIVDQIMLVSHGKKIQILAPLVQGRKGEYNEVFTQIQKQGFVRVRVDGNIYDLSEKISIKKTQKHNIDVVIDRIILNSEIKSRIADSVETAIKLTNGLVILSVEGEGDRLFSQLNACTKCGISYGELTPRMFSFNSPYGACTSCHGLGARLTPDPDLIIPDKNKSLEEGAIVPWQEVDIPSLNYNRRILSSLSKQYKFSLDIPYKQLPQKIKNIILYGTKGEKIKISYWREGKEIFELEEFKGVINNLEKRYLETESEYIREGLSVYMNELVCPDCHGARLRAESRSVYIHEKNIVDVCAMSIVSAKEFFTNIKLTEKERHIGFEIIKEIRERLDFMLNVGLGYLTLDRKSATLAGGEAQRIRLATQVGSSLVGVIYILDEPSIGLHQRDNKRLLNTLNKLKSLGNTVIVVEHDEETIRIADYIVDLGPGAGIHGGHIIAEGTLQDILNSPKSLTGQYLTGDLKIKMPKERKAPSTGYCLEIIGVKTNNLKNITVKIPLGLFVCITGVSGSGKSSFVNDTLFKALSRLFYMSKERPGEYDKINGIDHIDKVIVIDQSPIGRTPRSNPATYTGVFTFIRDLFSQLPDSKMRGYGPGRFSFNVKGGRCDACGGDGIIKIEMHFLPDVYVECEVCKGKRFNRETLEVRYKGKNISEVLASTVSEALEHFKNIPQIKAKLETLNDVGLGYIHLGQSATTLSGGEAQRIKLARELSRQATGRTLYILDEPTTGLHFADIQKLLNVLHRLRDTGNTILVVEHNLDVIKTADHIIDLGPEGGDGGGRIVAEGKPEDIVNVKESHTGQYLKPYLEH
jgi:excinuclease ABC subunit A